MEISNLVLEIQKLAKNSTEPLDLMTLAKSIEKLKVGSVSVVSTVNDLPSLPLEEDGYIYLVEDDGDLYYNIGNYWYYIITILPTGITYAWGLNTYGVLGDGTTVNKSSPVTVIGGISDWTQISSGGINVTVGMTETGMAYTWGNNNNGQLGDGTTVNKSSPVTVVGGITNWKQVSAGGGTSSTTGHVLGVTENGILYSWGRNINGVLGDGTTTNKSSPVTVIGGISDWVQVNTFGYSAVAIRSNKIAYTWGGNYAGILGDNTTVGKSSPVTVVGGITNWRQIGAGVFHMTGITEDGIAYSWGNNGFGRLGDNTSTAKSSPVTVAGGITNWRQISVSVAHTLGVTEDDKAYSWGINSSGQLGDGTTISRSSPVSVIGGIENWKQLSAGSYHSLGVTKNGIVYAWGGNDDGRLGDTTIVTKSSPIVISGGLTRWSKVISGNKASFGILSN